MTLMCTYNFWIKNRILRKNKIRIIGVTLSAISQIKYLFSFPLSAYPLFLYILIKKISICRRTKLQIFFFSLSICQKRFCIIIKLNIYLCNDENTLTSPITRLFRGLAVTYVDTKCTFSLYRIMYSIVCLYPARRHAIRCVRVFVWPSAYA